MKFVIMAGGSGTRLWPVSRKNSPKQVQPFIGEKSLLQTTYERLLKSYSQDDIFVSANISQKKYIVDQLPLIDDTRLILEPIKRDTAPAIGYAAIYLEKIYDQAVNFVTINSDAYVLDESEYFNTLAVLNKLIETHPGKCAMVGIHPTYPEVGYGYIKLKKSFAEILGSNEKPYEIFEVEKFIEKPDLKMAKQYLSKWGYLWNPALFVWHTATLLKKFQEFLPEHYVLLQKIKNNFSDEIINEFFPQMEPISIDYGIMEKNQDMLVVPSDFGWADIGHWRAVKDVLSQERENILRGDCVVEDSSGNLIYNYSDKLVCTVGLKNMVVVQTDDVLLICPKKRAQEVKKIVAMLKDQGKEKYL